MDFSQKHSRRNVLKTGLAAAAAATLPISKAKAQYGQTQGNVINDWVPKKPGEIRISAFCQDESQVLRGLLPWTNIENVTLYWDNKSTYLEGTATPEMIRDTDILVSFYSGFLYSDELRPVIMEEISKRGMGWYFLHNSAWMISGYSELCDFVGVYGNLHREVQQISISCLNQNHPITKNIEPFVINLDEQFGAYIANPNDPDFAKLFSGIGFHDLQWRLQGWSVQRG